MIDMSRQKDNVDKGGKAYIKTLPKREQERLLGVHGRNDVMSGKKEWLTSARMASKEDFEVRKPIAKESGAISERGKRRAQRRAEEFKEREAHAKMIYATLRNSDRDILIRKISQNSGMSLKSVQKVLEHILDNKYNLDKGYGNFDADFDMGNSLQRLRDGNPLSHDILLLKHERLEYELMNRWGYRDYNIAHNITSKKYDYITAVERWVENGCPGETKR